MNIQEIYKKYKIPPNLQEHMIRVAAIGAFIADHWNNSDEIDRDNLIQALLLHDMGNIIKFNLSDTIFKRENDEIESIKKVKEEFIKKYGDNEHIATEKIAKEIGVNEKILDMISRKGQSFTYISLHSNDPNKKIKSYSDFRIGPHGVISINERFDDLLKRYKGAGHFWSDEKNVESRRQWAIELEAQIQEKVTVDLQQINDETIKPYREEVENVSL